VFHRAGVCHVLRAGGRAGRAGAAPNRGGLLLGGCLQHLRPHDRAHYFLARARWELDQLGLAVAQLVALLAAPDDDRRPFLAKPPWSGRTRANPRCPRSPESSRCITTKLQPRDDVP